MRSHSEPPPRPAAIALEMLNYLSPPLLENFENGLALWQELVEGLEQATRKK